MVYIEKLIFYLIINHWLNTSFGYYSFQEDSELVTITVEKLYGPHKSCPSIAADLDI